MFSALSKKEIAIQAALNLLSANAFNLVKAKILLFGKEVNVAKIMISLYNKVENMVGKRENAG